MYGPTEYINIEPTVNIAPTMDSKIPLKCVDL